MRSSQSQPVLSYVTELVIGLSLFLSAVIFFILDILYWLQYDRGPQRNFPMCLGIMGCGSLILSSGAAYKSFGVSSRRAAKSFTSGDWFLFTGVAGSFSGLSVKTRSGRQSRQEKAALNGAYASGKKDRRRVGCLTLRTASQALSHDDLAPLEAPTQIAQPGRPAWTGNTGPQVSGPRVAGTAAVRFLCGSHLLDSREQPIAAAAPRERPNFLRLDRPAGIAACDIVGSVRRTVQSRQIIDRALISYKRSRIADRLPPSSR